MKTIRKAEEEHVIYPSDYSVDETVNTLKNTEDKIDSLGKEIVKKAKIASKKNKFR